jgi:type I restriction enzyme, S subunit
MGGDWSAMTTFANLVSAGLLAIGDGYRAQNEELGDSGPIFLRSAYLQSSGWSIASPDRLSHPFTPEFGAKIALEQDTVVTTKGNSLGRLGYVNRAVAGAVYSPHLSYWRSLDPRAINPRFLYFWAHSDAATAQIKARSDSTDMAPYLSLRDQLSLEIALPDIAAQGAVADLLGLLDDKIELNRRMADTLEATARALFKSWFVDFDPARAKAEGRSTGLPDDLTSLFPAQLGHDGLPEGWEGTNDELATVERASTEPGEVPPTTPYVGLEHIDSGRLVLRRNGNASDVSSQKFLFRTDDLLFGKLRPYFHKVVIAPFDGICSSDILVFRPRPGVPLSFLALAFSQDSFVNMASIASGGTRMPRADWNYMRAQSAVRPSNEALAAFEMLARPLLDQAQSSQAESNALATLRDTLLPKLVSGELRIRDAGHAASVA